jgi:hypothetical protein
MNQKNKITECSLSDMYTPKIIDTSQTKQDQINPGGSLTSPSSVRARYSCFTLGFSMSDFNLDPILQCTGNLDVTENAKTQQSNMTLLTGHRFIGALSTNRIKNSGSLWNIEHVEYQSRVELYCDDQGSLSYPLDHVNDISIFSNAFVQLFYIGTQKDEPKQLYHIYSKTQPFNVIRNIVRTEISINIASNMIKEWMMSLKDKLIWIRSTHGYIEALKWLYHYRLLCPSTINNNNNINNHPAIKNIIDITTLYNTIKIFKNNSD